MGKLFQKEGPTNKIDFCPIFVLWKRILSFANLFLVSIPQLGANSKIYLDNRTSAIDKFECNSVSTLINFFSGRYQFVDLKSSLDMWWILSILRQSLMHLFFIVCIFFFIFSVRLAQFRTFFKVLGLEIYFSYKRTLFYRLFHL